MKRSSCKFTVEVILNILVLLSCLSVTAQVTEKPSLLHRSLNEFINVRDFCQSSQEDEVFFTIQSPNQNISQIVYMTKENGEWTSPKLLPFCDSFMYLEPFLTYDGKRLFFVSDRPLGDGTQKKDFDIWYVTRETKNSAWSAPINLGAPVNTEYDEFYPTLSNNNNLYLTIDAPNGLGKDDIYVAEWNGNSYTPLVLLNSNINSSGYEFNAFISKNEDFLLYTKYNAKDGMGSGDLYMSRKTNGIWQKAENLGATVNSKAMEYCPYYDEKNNILYFTSRRDELHPKAFESIADFQAYINNSANGLSKLYKVKIDLN